MKFVARNTLTVFLTSFVWLPIDFENATVEIKVGIDWTVRIGESA